MTWFSRTYRWQTDAANGIDIDAPRMDTEFDGVATGLNTCLTIDGTNPAAANLPMGGFKLTGLAVGTASTDSATFGQIALNLSDWQPESNTVAYGSATTFTVTTNRTAQYTPGRRLKSINTGGTVYSTVISSAFTTSPRDRRQRFGLPG